MNTTDTFTDTYTLLPGRTPLLVSLPHIGTFIPEALRPAYTERALSVEDTDWHLDALYDFAREMGAGLLMPRCSRYVIDLNRPPENTPMYPGANNTELCPTRFFTGEPIYRDGNAPDAAEIDRRRATYWQPYHDALSAELARLRAAHGHAVLFDGHSIRAELPWLFEGRLPDLNLGTASGTSCAPSLRAALSGVLADQSTFSQVVDGRFKGGYITRRYGQPAERVHAVQLEMGWHCYMDDGLVSCQALMDGWREPSPHPNPPPLGEGARQDPDAPGLLPPAGGGREGGLRGQPTFDPARAARVQPVLRALLQTLRDWTPGAAE